MGFLHVIPHDDLVYELLVGRAVLFMPALAANEYHFHIHSELRH